METKKHLFFLCAVPFLAYLVLMLLYDSILLFDEVHYLWGGENIMNGNLPDAFYPHRPVHQYTIAVIYKIFGISETAVRLYVLLASVATVVLMYLLLKLRHDAEKSFLVSMLFASTIVFVSLSPTIMTDNLMVFYYVLAMYAYMRFLDSNDFRKLVFSGFIFGVCFLTRETGIFLVLPVLMHLLLKKNRITVVLFVVAFSILPVVYTIFTFSNNQEFPWLVFYRLNQASGLGFTLPYRIFVFMKLMLMSLGITAVPALYAIYKEFRNPKRMDNVTAIFASQFLLLAATIFLWSEDVRPRFFVALLPGLCYLITNSKLPGMFAKFEKKIFMLLIAVNFIVGIPVSYIYLTPHGVVNDALQWIYQNIPKDAKILSYDHRATYFLRHEGYTVYENPAPGIRYVLGSSLNQEEDRFPEIKKTKVKSFSRTFPLGFIAHKTEMTQFYFTVYRVDVV